MKNKIKVGSDFSGVGAFDYAIKRIHNNVETVYACDMDKFARESFIANHGEPKYYPENVYDREIPTESLDIYMTSPPCQSFSLAGKRKGKDSENGVLFFNSHEFIQKNKPRYFIFENVKGLLSDDNGNTFKEWCNMLGGKSINGSPVIFPFENSVPYHIYHKVLNSKKHGVPQNRERVFIIGIRDDSDNFFTWPKEEYLSKKLKDVLETDVDEKYFLSDKMMKGLISKDVENGYINQDTQASKVFSERGTSPTLSAGCHGYANGYVSTGLIQLNNPKHSNNRIFSEESISPTLTTMQGGNRQPFVSVKSATSKGYETATENDSINFTHPDSKTRRGRVEKEVAQTLDTACNQGVIVKKDGVVCFGRSEKEKQRRREHFKKTGEDSGSFKDKELIVKNQDYYDTLLASPNPKKEGLILSDYRIRRLTPRECHRLQDFPDSHKFVVSNSQLYKQAGNSITVRVLELIIRKLNL